MNIIAAAARKPAVPLQPVVDPAGWTKEEMQNSSDWIFDVSAEDIAEIESAVADVERRKLGIMDIRMDDFRLPRLGKKMAEIRRYLLDGPGLFLMRGLPVERWSRLQSCVAFWGMGTHFGDPIVQNGKGHMLGHVKDLVGDALSEGDNRGHATCSRLPFHVDGCDIVMLLCLQIAKAGGLSAVVSSITLHNEMLKRRPDLVAELAKPWYRDRRGEVPPGGKPWYELPIFNYDHGLLTTSFGSYVKSVQRFAELPRLTPLQLKALDYVEQLANEICLDMEFRRGDVQFVHNHVLLHSRTNYQDYLEPERKRHLLRFWLSCPEGRPLPAGFASRYFDLAPGQRPLGGIAKQGTPPNAPLEAE